MRGKMKMKKCWSWCFTCREVDEKVKMKKCWSWCFPFVKLMKMGRWRSEEADALPVVKLMKKWRWKRDEVDALPVVKLMKMGRRKREEVGTLLSWSWWENEEGGASKNDIYFCTEIDGSPIVYWKLLQEVSSYYKSEIRHTLRQSWCSQARMR